MICNVLNHNLISPKIRAIQNEEVFQGCCHSNNGVVVFAIIPNIIIMISWLKLVFKNKTIKSDQWLVNNNTFSSMVGNIINYVQLRQHFYRSLKEVYVLLTANC